METNRIFDANFPSGDCGSIAISGF